MDCSGSAGIGWALTVPVHQLVQAGGHTCTTRVLLKEKRVFDLRGTAFVESEEGASILTFVDASMCTRQ